MPIDQRSPKDRDTSSLARRKYVALNGIAGVRWRARSHICPRVEGRSIVVPSTTETLTPSYEYPLLNSFPIFLHFLPNYLQKRYGIRSTNFAKGVFARVSSPWRLNSVRYSPSIHLSSKRNPGIALTHAIISIGFAISRFPRPPPLLPSPNGMLISAESISQRKHSPITQQP